ncbi:hypothetical protein [Rhodobacter calidifons]|uniref:Uncharacterized protein n=1 Tax=Rhodobacter calidifons TaxID=2715277 RepID=A0ABX0G419_9RHOB|nr:hypothetical protein [Rhodobacter calidifons]NHB75599.1 hypothetical protein [Rhodobacter calidifons]
MFTSRSLTTGAATCAFVSLLAIPAFAGVDKIAKIDVQVDLSAVQNEQAAAYWATLETDLENALAARLVDRLVTEAAKPDDSGKIDGAQIIVDIREFELANALQRELNLGDAVLVGQVTIKDDTDNSNADGYELTTTLENAKVEVPEGMTVVLSTDTREAYTRLVDAFAEGVVTRLK